MLIRICLIVAIIAGLAVGGLNFLQVREKVTTLQADLKTEHGGRITAETDRDNTRKELDKTTKDLKQTKETLDATSAERDKAVAEAAAQIKRAGEMADKLVKATSERDDARAELAAYKSTGRTPDQILVFDKQIKQLQDSIEVANEEKKILQRAAARLQARLDTYESPEKFVTAPASLKGKILVTDPKWDFVVLNIGEDQGVMENCEFLVNRDGKLVAKVVVRTIQKNRCIANVVPGWKLGDVFEGDQVIPAHPAS